MSTFLSFCMGQLTMALQKRSTRWLLSFVGVATFLLISLPLYRSRDHLGVPSTAFWAQDHLDAIRNETLGVCQDAVIRFEKPHLTMI